MGRYRPVVVEAVGGYFLRRRSTVEPSSPPSPIPGLSASAQRITPTHRPGARVAGMITRTVISPAMMSGCSPDRLYSSQFHIRLTDAQIGCDSRAGNVSNLNESDLTEPTGEALVRSALADPGSPGSQEAASALFGRYRRRVYTWCHRYVRDHEKALDLAQDVLLGAYRALGTFQEHSRFSSWLYAITRNRCFNELRRPAVFVGEEIDMDQLVDPGADQAESLIQKLDEEEVLRLIHEHLDPLEQEVLWLRCFERMPIEMITETLRIRQASGARGVLQRARRTLRAALESRGHALAGERRWTTSACGMRIWRKWQPFLPIARLAASGRVASVAAPAWPPSRSSCSRRRPGRGPSGTKPTPALLPLSIARYMAVR